MSAAEQEKIQIAASILSADLARLRRMLDGRGLERVLIAVDGGIHPRTAAVVVRAGARVLVARSAIFNRAASVTDNLRELRAAIAASV